MDRIYLDVDGVLNAYWYSGWVQDDGGVPGVPKWAVGEASDWKQAVVDGYVMTWRPALVEQLNNLVADGLGEIVWLTTWGSRAADVVDGIAGVMGLGEWRALKSREEFWTDVEGPVDYGSWVVWPTDYHSNAVVGGAESETSLHGDVWWKTIELARDLSENPLGGGGGRVIWVDDDLGVAELAVLRAGLVGGPSEGVEVVRVCPREPWGLQIEDVLGAISM